MDKLNFTIEWTDPEGARGDELRATWARFELKCADEVITRIHNYVSHGVSDSIYLPLYPLAEWIVANWWALLHEVETPDRTLHETYAQRHSFRYAREGFGLPDLLLKPSGGNEMSLTWKASKDPNKRIDYISQSSCRLDQSEVTTVLKNFLTTVIERLEDFKVSDTFLQNEWRSITSMKEEEAEFCRIAGMLGLDPFDVPGGLASSIIESSKKLPQDILLEFYHAADAMHISSETAALVDFTNMAKANATEWKKMKEIRADLAALAGHTLSPWELGYSYAKELRRYLHLDGQPLPDTADLGLALGKSDLPAALIPQVLSLSAIDGMVALNQTESPVFSIVQHQVFPKKDEAIRFAFSRALFQFLTGQSSALDLVTKANTERQKSNRAFAAEFLAPADSLRARLPSRKPDEETIDELASFFGVSPFVIRHQLINHRLVEPESLSWNYG